jgi:hypothetical protein
MAEFTVTDNTSVVLINTIGSKVFLSSLSYPGHIVTIKDYAGVASQGSSIVVSTTQNVFFADGSFSTLIQNPFGSLTVSSKSPNVWQLLNNVAFQTTLSNAYLNQLTADSAYITLTSSSTEYVSTANAGRVNVTKSINLEGNNVIIGDIIAGNTVDLFSTVNASENIRFSSGLIVNGTVTQFSSVIVRGNVNAYKNMSTLNTLIVNQALTISTSLYVQGALFPRNLSVQTVTFDTVNMGAGLQTADGISVGSNVYLGDSLTGRSTLRVMSSIFTSGNVSIFGDLNIGSNTQANSLRALSSLSVIKETIANSISVQGNFSTQDSVFIAQRTLANFSTIASTVVVTNRLSVNTLTVGGNISLSTVSLQGNLSVQGSASFYEGLTTSSLQGKNTSVQELVLVGGRTNVSSFFSTLNSMTIGSDLTVGSTIVAKDRSYISSLLVGSTASIFASLSTTSFYTKNLEIYTDFIIPGTAKLGVLGAPIEVTLNTLNLSNTLTVNNSSFISYIQATSTLRSIPSSMQVNLPASTINFNGFLYTNPDARIQGLVEDLNLNFDGKRISSFRTSNLIDVDKLNAFTIGSNDFLQPLSFLNGFLATGSNSYKFQGSSFNSVPVTLNFQYGANRAFYNSNQNLWVVGGNDSLGGVKTMVTSSNGIIWNEIASGGFTNFAIDVTYMFQTLLNASPPVWLAVGGMSNSTYASIQYSGDGSNWSNASGTLFADFGTTLLYYPLQNESQGGVAFAGGNGGLGNFGIRYTTDGVNWNQGTGSAPFQALDLTIGGDSIYAVGFNPNGGAKTIYKLSNLSASNWTAWSNVYASNAPSILGSWNTLCYANGIYLLGISPPAGNNPLKSILWLNNNSITEGQGWSDSVQGGFSHGTESIIFNSNYNIFIAVGSNSDGKNIQYSADGSNWFSESQTYPEKFWGISYGSLLLPDLTSKFFTANVETRFQTGISSATLQASTITTSSIRAEYFTGDASQLRNVNAFGSRMGISSILTDYVAFNSTFYFTYGSTLTSNLSASRTSLFPREFLSTQNLWIAVGEDSTANGKIQETGNVLNWQNATSPNFQYFGYGIYGNSNQFLSSGVVITNQPFFIASGADSKTQYTIQYSQEGLSWNPVVSGGFDVANSNGYKVGYTVGLLRYLSNSLLNDRWLVGGSAVGTASTIFYSDDGSNFFSASNTPAIAGEILKIKTNNTYRALAIPRDKLPAWSDNGVEWTQTDVDYYPIPHLFLATNYGYLNGSFQWVSIEYYESRIFTGDGSNLYMYSPTATNIINAQEIVYNSDSTDGYWLAINNYQLYATSTNILNWTLLGSADDIFLGANSFQTLFWDKDQQRWFLGASSTDPLKTLWTSIDGSSWTSIGSGGFTSGVLAVGAGYAAKNSIGDEILLAGTGSFGGLTELRSQILNFSTIMSITYPTTYIRLTASNGSNVFSTSVFGLAADASVSPYNRIALGDGITPARTIARSSDGSNWIPAITGGFSPAGYDALYYSPTSNWIAVGASPSIAGTIQYSPDGANWFTTNDSTGIPLGGRAIAKMLDTDPYPDRLVVVGEAPYNFITTNYRTIVYSDNGFNWSNITAANGFQFAGYGVTRGVKNSAAVFMAVGKPYFINSNTIDVKGSIQFSSDGISWSFANSGGFEVAGYGVAYGNNRWVAVGENSNSGGSNTIKYSLNGADWFDANNGHFYYAGYAVTHNASLNRFIAVGKGRSNTDTVQVSLTGINWTPITQLNEDFDLTGFIQQETIGSAYGVFGQRVFTTENQAYLEFPKLAVYERDFPITYPIPTIRLLSTAMTFNEAVTVNLSSQVLINTFTPYDGATVTVQGNVQVSSLIYNGTEPTYHNSIVSSIIVSTLQNSDSIFAKVLATSTLGIGTSTLANAITYSSEGANSYLNVNNTLFTQLQTNLGFPKVGINTMNPTVDFDVNNSIATSSLSTAIFMTNRIDFTNATPNSVYIDHPNLVIYEGGDLFYNRNSICSEKSTLTFNNSLTVNLSTQRVGYYTKNPQFDFDARTAGYIQNLTTQELRTQMLFFTLQSV